MNQSHFHSPSFVLGPTLTPQIREEIFLPKTVSFDPNLQISHLLINIPNSKYLKVEACPDEKSQCQFQFTSQEKQDNSSDNSEQAKSSEKIVTPERLEHKNNEQEQKLSLLVGPETLRSILSPISEREKPKFSVSRKVGTIYEDWKTKVKNEQECKTKLEPFLINEMKKCQQLAEMKETQKHEQRLRILYRFRLKRLHNTFMQQKLSQLCTKPLIFTPNGKNPFSPSLEDMKQKITTCSERLQELSLPQYRNDVNFPDAIDHCSPEISKILNDMRHITDIRQRYHWTSFFPGYHTGKENKKKAPVTTHSKNADSTTSGAKVLDPQLSKRTGSKVSDAKKAEMLAASEDMMNQLNQFEMRLEGHSRKK
ncbi:hypothetical protein RFI_32366 [Reticulomyxa filosa]|uniref:Uncharacterized protein n=1 Tax=Reticulomyxa filosa TaxID=46433 RepID=X6LTR4_RETFI|nr:hypothetical protein RFI_32366 [Reticulomyxa filosa]|eukprot:ETO05029.1 hypothetical protein RFI_32366 [Reticulomyxa filosa]